MDEFELAVVSPASNIIGKLQTTPEKKNEIEKEEPRKNIDLEKIKQVWNQVDVNKDNELDISEIRQIFQKLGENVSDEQIKKLIQLIDLDGSKTISLEEFLTLMTPNSEITCESVIDSFKFFENDSEQNTISISNLKEIMNSISELLSPEEVEHFCEVMEDFSDDKEMLDYKKFVSHILEK